MEAKVTWNKGLSFTGSADSGFSLPLGSKAGDEDGFRPMELFAIGLVGCTGMDVVSILEKKRQVVTAFDVQVHIERATEHPMVFTSAVIEYRITGRGIDEAAVLRSIELSATRYCPAQFMLGKVMPIMLKYQIFEAGKDGEADEPTLVASGVYAGPSEQVRA